MTLFIFLPAHYVFKTDVKSLLQSSLSIDMKRMLYEIILSKDFLIQPNQIYMQYFIQKWFPFLNLVFASRVRSLVFGVQFLGIKLRAMQIFMTDFWKDVLTDFFTDFFKRFFDRYLWHIFWQIFWTNFL